MLSTLVCLSVALSQGASVTAGAGSEFANASVSASGKALHAIWNANHTVKFWRTGNGRVTFDGITFVNHSKQRVIVRATEVTI